MIKRKDKIIQLQNIVARNLVNLIDRDYVIFGIPYYLNVGDILIWEGEKHFLNKVPYKCINEGFRYNDYWRIRNDTLIILQGGGNFGDLWRWIQVDRLNIIQKYKSNPIIITPVTCWYDNISLLDIDAEIMSQHKNLVICARDLRSYDFLRKNFKNKILLVPDMAFCIDTEKLEALSGEIKKCTLFLKRLDKELAESTQFAQLHNLEDVDIRDWPSIEHEPSCWIYYKKICKYGNYFKKYSIACFLSQITIKFSDWYYHTKCRRQLIKDGVKFVSQYKNIYTTRLHVGILAILLDKDVTIIDNSYGKNSCFYNTWLADTEGVSILSNQ